MSTESPSHCPVPQVPVECMSLTSARMGVCSFTYLQSPGYSLDMQCVFNSVQFSRVARSCLTDNREGGGLVLAVRSFFVSACVILLCDCVHAWMMGLNFLVSETVKLKPLGEGSRQWSFRNSPEDSNVWPYSRTAGQDD